MLATDISKELLCRVGQKVIETEIKAIEGLIPRIGIEFSQACELMLHCEGRVVVLGMGKSGHIASKIAATLASTGTPAFFVHPGEASHGDMGMITKKDVALTISNSGETPEVLNLVPFLKRFGVPMIAMTGKPSSSLARAANVHLNIGVEAEACSMGLAPTASTTATLVMGDALSIALLEARGFTPEDFAEFHPGGALGRRLLLRVEDIMHKGSEIPMVTTDCMLDEALIEVTQKSLGMTVVVDEQGQVAGVFTDGDLRRTLDHGHDIHATQIKEVMTKNCLSIDRKCLAAEALGIMETNKVTALLVVDASQRPVGVLHMHDLLRAGVI